jgi:hypothetical protein
MAVTLPFINYFVFNMLISRYLSGSGMNISNNRELNEDLSRYYISESDRFWTRTIRGRVVVLGNTLGLGVAIFAASFVSSGNPINLLSITGFICFLLCNALIVVYRRKMRDIYFDIMKKV